MTISNRQAKQIRESMAQTKPSEKRGFLMAMLGYSPEAKEAEALEAVEDTTPLDKQLELQVNQPE